MEIDFNIRKILASLIFKQTSSFYRVVLNQKLPNLYILGYHRIADFSNSNYPYNKKLISASPDDFDKQMQFLKNNFNVINFYMLHNILSSGNKIPEKSIIITFDDGYSDNYYIAFDILKSHGLTAVLFVSTSFVENQEPFWFEKVTYIINNTPPCCLELGSGKYIFKLTDSNRNTIRNKLRKLLSHISNRERLNFLDEIDHQTQISIPLDDFNLARPLNWDQVCEMSREGIEIGSHTKNHPYLENLNSDEIIDEIDESKRIIEEKIGKEIISLAYPSGSYDENIISYLEKSNYFFGISNNYNATNFSEDLRYCLPRIYIDSNVDYALFRANLLIPNIFVHAYSSILKYSFIKI